MECSQSHPYYVIGDIHGQFKKLAMLLREAVLVDDVLVWAGGRQLIHGHTPIVYIRQIPPKHVSEPLIYADGLCINIDGGMYLDDPRFVYQLPKLDATRAQRRVPAGSYTDQE